MMSFYRPRGRTGVSELWCRCHLCYWSGPLDDFLIGELEGTSDLMYACQPCIDHAQQFQELLRRGWEFGPARNSHG